MITVLINGYLWKWNPSASTLHDYHDVKQFTTMNHLTGNERKQIHECISFDVNKQNVMDVIARIQNNVG